MTQIHPSATVAPGAVIGEGCRIGPGCLVGPRWCSRTMSSLIGHVVVEGRTRIGADSKVFPFATIGMAPQDLKYRDQPTAARSARARSSASTPPSIAAASAATASPASAPTAC